MAPKLTREQWKKAAKNAVANANMWMDEAVNQRERADVMESRFNEVAAYATGGVVSQPKHLTVRDGELVWITLAGLEREFFDMQHQRDEARKALTDIRSTLEATNDAQVEAMQAELDRARDDERLHAWGRITRHPFFDSIQFGGGTLTDAMIAALDDAVEAMIVDADVAEADPVEERARELVEIALGPGGWELIDHHDRHPYRNLASHQLRKEADDE